MRSSITTLLLLSLVMTGCMRGGDPIAKHEAAPTPKTDPAPTPKPISANLTPDYIDQILRTHDVKKIKTDAILPLSNLILDLDLVQNPSLRGQPQDVYYFLHSLNWALDFVLTREPADPELQAVLDTYEHLLLQGCDPQLDGCSNLAFFLHVPNSSQVALQLALRKQQDVNAHYNLLYLSIQLGNRSYNSKVFSTFIAGFPKFLEANQEQYVRKERFSHTLSTILTDYSDRVAKIPSDEAEIIKNTLKTIKVWELTKSSHISAELRPKILNLGLQLGMMYENNRIAPELRSYMAKVRNTSGSLAVVEAELLKNGAALKKILRDSKISLAEAEFVIDQVFLERWSPEEGLAFWNQVQAKDKTAKLLQTVEAAFRIRFFQTLFDTNKTSLDLVFSKKTSTSDILTRAFQTGGLLASKWAYLRSKLKMLENFSVTAIRRGRGTAEEISKTSSLFASLETNIKFLSEFPQMVVLMYHMAKNRGDHVVRTNFGPRKFSSSDVIGQLMRGKNESWFEYSHDRTPLTEQQIPVALDLAISSGSLEMFGIDVDDLISIVSQQIVDERVRNIVQKFQDLPRKIKSSDQMKRFESACSALQTKDRFYFSIPLEKLENGVLRTIYDNAFNTVSVGGFYLFDGSFGEDVETLRIDFPSVIRKVRALRSSYVGYLKSKNLSQDEVKKLSHQSEVALERLESSRIEAQENILNLHHRMTRCNFDLPIREIEILGKITEYEGEFLRQVHRDMVRLRDTTLSEEAKQAIVESYKISGFGEFSGYDSISAETFIYSQFNLFVRFAQYLKKGLKTSTVNLPPIEISIDIILPKAENLNENTTYLAQISTPIQFSSDVDVFLGDAGRMLFGTVREGSFTNWKSIGDTFFHSLRTAVHSMPSMYRLQNVRRGKPVTAEETIELYEKLMKVPDLSTAERALRTKSHAEPRIPYSNFGGLYIQGYLGPGNMLIITEYMPLYDSLLRRITVELLGFSLDNSLMMEESFKTKMASPAHVPPRLGAFQTAKDYFLSRRSLNRTEFLFPPSEGYDSSMDHDITAFVLGEKENMSHFLDVFVKRIKEISSLPTDNRPKVYIATNRLHPGPYYSDKYITDQPLKMEKFDTSTGFCFTKLSQKKCPAFQ